LIFTAFRKNRILSFLGVEKEASAHLMLRSGQKYMLGAGVTPEACSFCMALVITCKKIKIK
jgi:hypothetical protein